MIDKVLEEEDNSTGHNHGKILETEEDHWNVTKQETMGKRISETSELEIETEQGDYIVTETSETATPTYLRTE